MKWQSVLLAFGSFVLIMAFQNCGGVVKFSNTGPSENENAQGGNPEKNFSRPEFFDPSKNICQPFDPNDPQDPDNMDPKDRTLGIVSQLYYRADNQPRFSTVGEYIEFGQKVDANIFMNRLFIPTRPFTEGFKAQNGEIVQREDGTPLFEFFALDFYMDIVLGSNDSAGKYQFAVLSDDGSVLYMKDENGDWQERINNDGETPTRMGCAMEPIEFEADKRVSMNLQYYQGPRTHIALVFMWRPWPGEDNKIDPQCGQSGNERFFKFENGQPELQQAYLDLLDRGWSPLEKENFKIPKEFGENPCQDVPAPQISNLQAVNVTSTTVKITWTTDVESRSQVAYRQADRGDWIISEVREELKTDHQFDLSDLAEDQVYQYQVQSASDSGSATISPIRTFRTQADLK